MNRMNRSVLAIAVAGSLCGGVGFVQAGYTFPGQNAAHLDEHWKYVHMHHALAALKEARHELDEAEDIFHGHKQDAVDHVDSAIKAIHEGLREQNEDEDVAMPSDLPAANKLEDRFPHMRHALERLKDAKSELETADHVFGHHRELAINHVDKALRQIEDGLHDAGA